MAENSGGAHCLKYGFTTNHVLEAEVVLAGGELVRLSEDDSLDLLGAVGRLGGHAGRGHRGGGAGAAAAAAGGDAAGRLRVDRPRGRGGVGDHRRRHHPGGDRDDGRAHDRGRRGGGRRGAAAGRGRGAAGRAGRSGDRGRAGAGRGGASCAAAAGARELRQARRRGRASRLLARPQGGVRGDGPDQPALLRAGRRRAAHAAARDAAADRASCRSGTACGWETSSTPATATCIRWCCTTRRSRASRRGRSSWPPRS